MTNPLAINWGDFEYPIQCFIDDVGQWYCSSLINEPLEFIDCENFVDITKFDKVYYAESVGTRWIFVIRRKNGYYVYFNAYCDKVFDLHGKGTIIYGKDPLNMFTYGFDDNMRAFLPNFVFDNIHI